MKVLQINATYGYGSTGLIMKDIGEALESSGGEAHFAYQTANGHVKNGYAVGNMLDHRAHAILCRLFGRQGYYSKGATKKLIRYIEKIKPDVVHLHNLHSNFVHLNFLLHFLGNNDIPTVITMHDCWCFTGKCFHYVDVGCDGFTKDCKNCPKKKAPPASIFFDCSSGVLRDRNKYIHAIPRLKIIGCSEWICREARKGFMKDLDIEVIRNGVDTTVFKALDKDELKREKGLDGKFVIMGMANKWLLPSNAEFFEKAMSSLCDNDRVLLVGCSEEQINNLGKYGDKLIAVGFIKNREELAKLYASADVFVNVTHADTLPTVNMESICCGTPVVTYDSCGSPELILDGCGYVVDENDVDELIKKIELVKKTDFGNIAEIGKEKFDKNTCYKDYVRLYEDMIG